jgi:hypothetical protein
MSVHHSGALQAAASTDSAIFTHMYQLCMRAVAALGAAASLHQTHVVAAAMSQYLVLATLHVAST